MPPQLLQSPAEDHAHPIVAMMGGIALGLIMGGISVYYWEEMLKLQDIQNAREQQQNRSISAEMQTPTQAEGVPAHLNEVTAPFK